MTDHDIAVLAVVLNAVGAAITIFASTVAYTQYRRATKQLLKLRYADFQTSYRANQPGMNQMGERVFSVDLLSYGAAIWDLEVKFEFIIPATFDKHGKQLTPLTRNYHQFEPAAATIINPLNTGQARKFEF